MNPRNLRLQSKLSQVKLAALVGLTQHTISAWELGKRRLSPEVEQRVLAELRRLQAEQSTARQLQALGRRVVTVLLLEEA